MHKELSGASVCVTHTFKVFCSGWFMTHLNSVDHGMRKIISLKALWKKKTPKNKTSHKLSTLISMSSGE